MSYRYQHMYEFRLPGWQRVFQLVDLLENLSLDRKRREVENKKPNLALLLIKRFH